MPRKNPNKAPYTVSNFRQLFGKSDLVHLESQAPVVHSLLSFLLLGDTTSFSGDGEHLRFSGRIVRLRSDRNEKFVVAAVLLSATVCSGIAKEVKVKGYTKKDGTKNEG